MNRRSFLFSALSLLVAPFLRGQDKSAISTEKLNAKELLEGGKAAPEATKKALTKSAKRATIYPFDVRIGGQLAVVEGNPESAIFARIPQPVTADAAIEVDGPAGMLIVNVFPVEPDGKVPERSPIKVMMQQSGTSVRLDQTMDKSVLTPGLYGANIVFTQTTSRVMFEVR